MISVGTKCNDQGTNMWSMHYPAKEFSEFQEKSWAESSKTQGETCRWVITDGVLSSTAFRPLFDIGLSLVKKLW